MKSAKPMWRFVIASLVSPGGFAFPTDYILEAGDTGVYSLAFEDLADFRTAPAPFTEIGVSQGGHAVPHWVVDQDSDGEFGPLDRIEFVVPPPNSGKTESAGQSTLLRIRPTGTTSRAGTVSPPGPAPATDSSSVHDAVATVRVEQNLLRTAFSLPDFTRVDAEYWERLSPLDAAPFTYQLDESAEWEGVRKSEVSLTFSLRGATWANSDEEEFSDHAVNLASGNRTLSHEWSGKNEEILTLSGVDFENGNESVELSVPSRTSPTGEFLADVSYLNWLEWTAPLSVDSLAGLTTAIPLSSTTADHSQKSGVLKIEIPPTSEGLSVYSESGTRWDFPTTGGEFTFGSPDEKWIILASKSIKKPVGSVRILRKLEFKEAEPGKPSYLLIIPGIFEAKAKELVGFHAKRGYSVQVAATEGIADSYGGGSLDQKSIRLAIREWFSNAKSGLGNYVLLAGDASWERPGEGRNLIPTTSQLIDGSLCASDNPYACIDDGNSIPKLAVGRLPVATLEEFEAALAKITAPYENEEAEGVKTLWIVDQNRNSQNAVGSILLLFDQEAAASELIFAWSEDENNARLDRIRDSISEGYDWVFYHGHGGRHVWRTGTADYANQSSMFDSGDVSSIAGRKNSTPARVIFSSSCDNAPFDHPTDDSLGERFVSVPGAGSLTFIGASWRVVSSLKPLRSWSAALADRNNDTVGAAFLSMKKSIQDPRFITAFNLLGDPATPLRGKHGNSEASDKQ